MKKTIPLIVLSSLILSSCDSFDFTSFKDYTDIVKNATEDQKDIFVFTASSCGTCQEVVPLIEKYIKENEESDVSIYLLSVDYEAAENGKYMFKDKSMGYLSGDASNDFIKVLDNRIIEFVMTQGDYSNYLSPMTSGNYLYVSTPLAIFYEGGIEVKITNMFAHTLSISDKDERYEEIKNILKFPEEKPNWNKTFDIDYYKS